MMFNNTTTTNICNESILSTSVCSHQSDYNPSGNSWLQQSRTFEDINELMDGSQTAIRKKHQSLNKLKGGTSIIDYMFTVLSRTSKKVLTCQELIKKTSFDFKNDDSLKRFIDVLERNDKNTLLDALVDINDLSYVENIEFDNNENATLIIRLSEMDREIEEKIYQIEYDLLGNFKTNIDFLVLPV